LFIAAWFFFLAVGAGAGFAAMKVWPARKDRFAARLLWSLHSPMIIALTAILLPFMARDVHLTWKFTITWFVGMVLSSLTTLPLILMLIKGLKE
jgi:hypothetical protein